MIRIKSCLIILVSWLGLTSTAYSANSIIVNASGKVDFGANAFVDIAGDFTNKSLAFNPGSATVKFYGSQTGVVSGTVPPTFSKVIVNKSGAAIVQLNTDVTISNSLTFLDGNIQTGAKTLTLGNAATLTGEGAGQYVVGNLKTTRAVGTAASTLGGLGLQLSNGADDLGQVTVTRVAGPTGVTQIGGVNGIARNWQIGSERQPLHGRDITFNWVQDNDNGLNLASLQVWRGSGNLWYKVGSNKNGVARSVTVNTVAFSTWTMNNTVGRDSRDINGDGERTVADIFDIANYVLTGQGLDSYQRQLADRNVDNTINIKDVVTLAQQFRGRETGVDVEVME